jgi:homoisocitrate dehydrogenase
VGLLIVRENTEGLYVGEEHGDGERATALRVITESASRRIAHRAYELAQAEERRRVTIAHKANILPLTCGLFRDAARRIAAEYPDVETDEMLVDALAFRLAHDPESFDVILTTNLFGDILSDLAAVWCGGMGMAPSVNLGDENVLAEPVHGAAPDIAGQGIANPLAAILSAALLLRYGWGESTLASMLEQAVDQVLRDGARTPDLVQPGERAVSTVEMEHLVHHALDSMRKE